MKLQSYVDMLNRVELFKTWKTSGVSAAMFALLAYLVLNMAGFTDRIGDVTLFVAALSGAIGKFAAELKRLGEGKELPPAPTEK